MKARFESPLPSGATFTKKDCSINYLEVVKLQEEFGFEYAAAIGSLIYLMNTFVKTTFAIRKLAKYMQFPGRPHFKYLLHLLKHLQCHRCSAGLKFYSEVKLSPIYQNLRDAGHGKYAECPIIFLSDSSFQDDIDTSRSTGGYIGFMQGAPVDHYSGCPVPISDSTCEAEYCMYSLALRAAAFLRKIFNEFNGYDSDKPMTVPLGVDSQSAIDTAKSEKETSRTRHIARRMHYVRLCLANGDAILMKLEGTKNCANSLTKALTARELVEEAAIYQTEVDP
jgi:hypothetical protein